MKKPPLGDSAATLRKDFGVYHLTRLKADKKAQPLAGLFETAQNRLKEKEAAFEAAHEATQAAMAIRDTEDEALDAAVRQLYGAIVTASNNNLKSPLFARYFPAGMRSVVAAPLEEELQRVSALVAKLDEEPLGLLKSYGPLLVAGSGNLRAAIVALKAAMDAENKANGMVEAEKLIWLDAYTRSYRDLGRLFYDQPKKAGTFFKVVSSAKAKGKKGNGAGIPAPPAPTK